MASPARPAAFGLPHDPAAARCSFDQTRFRTEQDLQDSRLVRTFVNVYGHEGYPKEAVMTAVEECMRRQAEGGTAAFALRSDVMDYHSEGTVSFCCLEKNLRQVQRSVQMLHDKHGLADVPQELAKLQIVHEFPARTHEAAALSMLAARENDHNTKIVKHEVSLVPIHQVNGMQSPAMPVQSSSGYIMQQLVPVSLGTQHDQQHPSQAALYYMQSQNHFNCTENKPSESFVHSMQPHVQNPEGRVAVELNQKCSQATELHPPSQHHMLQAPTQHVESQAWRSHSHVTRQQQYSVQQVPAQIIQQKTASPQAQSAPQVTLMYPPYCSQKPASATSTTEPLLRSLVPQSSYSSPQQKHQEVMPSLYGQGSQILLPTVEHNIQHQQPHSQGSCPPQPNNPSHCSVASYAVQGSGQTYSAMYRNPADCPAAVLPQHAASTPMVFHHLGPQVMHNHPFGTIFETPSVVGYTEDQVRNMTLPVVTAAQPVDSNAMADKLNAGSNVTSPRDWSA